MNFESKSKVIPYPDIAHEIEHMVEVDQHMRAMCEIDESWDDSIDVEHTERMKEIVNQIGWPTVSKVGKETATKAWLLVQHADHDVAFQEYCLDLMKSESLTEVSKIDMAYLEDRVRVNKGLGQLYGTQFTQEDNKHIPRFIEDESNVDKRRAEVGMGPLTEQIQHMYDKYPMK